MVMMTSQRRKLVDFGECHSFAAALDQRTLRLAWNIKSVRSALPSSIPSFPRLLRIQFLPAYGLSAWGRPKTDSSALCLDPKTDPLAVDGGVIFGPSRGVIFKSFLHTFWTWNLHTNLTFRSIICRMSRQWLLTPLVLGTTTASFMALVRNKLIVRGTEGTVSDCA